MRIPTKKVIVRATGQEVVINADDFNPKVHESIKDASSPPDFGPALHDELPVEPEKGKPDNFDPVGLEEVTVELAKEIIGEAQRISDLDNLEAGEKTGKNRSTVLKAIDRRRKELSDA